MNKLIVSLFLLLCLFPASLFSNTIYFPQVAFGGGYSTRFVILNTGTTAVSGRLNVYSQTGVSRPNLSVSNISIDAGGSARLVIPDAGALTVVWAEFVAGSGKVQGVATFELRNSAGRLIASAGVVGLEGGTNFLVPVDVTANGATGLAINNASQTPLSLTLRLIGENGTVVMTGTDTRFLPLGPRAQVADFVTNIFPQLGGTTFKGSLAIEAPPGTATGALAATALTVNEGLLAALPVIAKGSTATALEFSQIAYGGGYSTTLTILNTSATPAVSNLRIYTQSGAPRLDLGTTLSIAAGGSARYVFPDVGPLTVVWGELIATAGTVQGTATFEVRAKDGALITAAGIPAVQPGNGYVFPLDVTAPSESTGIAMANTGNGSFSVGFRVLGESGSEVLTTPDNRFNSLGPRAQTADFATNVFPQLDANFKGSLSIRAATGAPANSLAVTALTVKEDLLSALPVIPDTISCKLPEAANRGDVGLGFPRYFNRLAATGTVRVKLLFVDFSDAPATQTPQQVYSILSPAAPDFFRTISYGRLNYQLDPYFVWLRMSKPSTGYGWSSLTAALHRAYVQEAVTLADPNVDFSSSDIVYVIANPAATALPNGPTLTSNSSFTYTADGRTFYNAVTSGADLPYWGFRWLNHEAGHTMGLVDLYGYQGDAHRFVGGFGMMGLVSGAAPEYLAYERWFLGWLDDAQISCQLGSDSTVTLTAIESGGGIVAAMVPTGPTSAVIVESRRAIGYDTALPKSGVLVYTVDTSIASGNGTIQVYPNNADKYQSPLRPGDLLTVGKVTITVTQATTTGDTVRITVAP